RRLAASEGQRSAATLLDQAQRGKAPMLLADLRDQVGRHQMAVDVDDHRDSFCDSCLLRAAAIMSPSCAILIGRLFTFSPSGRMASLTALSIAAGAPR